MARHVAQWRPSSCKQTRHGRENPAFCFFSQRPSAANPEQGEAHQCPVGAPNPFGKGARIKEGETCFSEAASSLWVPASAGVAFGLALMLSLGPQNTFLIRQGLSRCHVWTTATTGYLSDLILVLASLAGFGVALTSNPSLISSLTWLGVFFLATCGVRAIVGAMTTTRVSISAFQPTRARAVLRMLTVTWANPLYYVEVLIPFGLLSARFSQPMGARVFAAGVLAASFLRFYGFSLAASKFASFFERPGAIRRLDMCAGILLLALAFCSAATMLRAATVHAQM